jgi:hypothetical protein
MVGPGAPTEPDTKIQTYFGMGGAPVLGKIAEPPKPLPWWRHFYVPLAGRDERLVCPKDHIFLPENVANGQAAGEVIAVIGARASGKSNFFGVLLNSLRRQHVQHLKFDLIDADTYGPGGKLTTADLYNERYWKYLFDPNRPTVVPQTDRVKGQAVRAAEDPRIPLIYMFRFHKRSWHYVSRPFAHRIPVYFMIYDAAGEDMTNPDALDHFYKFIRRATGIIFLIDPFDYPGLRSQLQDDVRKQLKPPQVSPVQVVDEVIKLYHREGVRVSGRINTPVAFALTKSDLFAKTRGLLDKNSALLRDSSHPGGFDRGGCEELHREVVECIRQWDSAELVEKARNNFSHFQFFALSALGSQPKGSELIQSITPKRIADPLLWLLWIRGYIPEAPK